MSYKNRQDYNRALVKILSELVEECPSQRFTQLLNNIDVVYDYNPQPQMMNPKTLNVHEESKDTFQRVLDSTMVQSYGVGKTLKILFAKDKNADSTKG